MRKPNSGRMRVTLQNVAEVAEVSKMTVSNFINGRFDSMSHMTRLRVEKAIKVLNYRPDSAGRSLRRTRHNAVGMIVVDESPTFLANPFVTFILAGLSNFLSERGYGMLLQGLKPQSFQNSTLIRHIGSDAICAILSGERQQRARFINILAELQQPIVIFEETLRTRRRDICVIRADEYAGMQLLVSHLMERGARDLVLLVPHTEWPGMLERQHGVQDAAKANHARIRIVHCASATFAAALEALGRWLESNPAPDAVLAGNDQMGIGAMRALRERGLTIPDDVKVTGFNGFEFSRYAETALTTVEAPCYELGTRAGEELLNRLESGRFASREIVLPVRLMLGRST